MLRKRRRLVPTRTPPADVGVGPFAYASLEQIPHDGRRSERIAGDLVVSAVPSFWHQRVAMKSVASLRRAEEAGHGLVVTAPTGATFGGQNVRFIARERLTIAAKEGEHGTPDLVVEVESRRRAVRLQLRLHARFGVPSCGIVGVADPDGETLCAFAMGGQWYPPCVTSAAGRSLGCPVVPGIDVDMARQLSLP